MTEIVERLREMGREYWQHKQYYDEAADEIERLRASVDLLRKDNAALRDVVDPKAEIERLRSLIGPFLDVAKDEGAAT